MRSTKREKIFFVLIAIIVLMGVGYAYLTTNLNIVGSSLVKGSRWDVYWDNVQVSQGSVTADAGPTIDVNKTTVTYTVTLNEPGDYFEFTVDAVNGGTIDAMIVGIDVSINGLNINQLPEYLDFAYMYSDGTPIGYDFILPAGEEETYLLRIKYKDNIDASNLPEDDQIFNISFGIEYAQQGEGAVNPRNFIYNDDGVVSLNGSINDISDPLNDASEANKGVFLRHIVLRNQIAKTDVGFVFNNEYYYLFTPNIPAMKNYYFDKNKEILNNVFGSDKCHIDSYDDSYVCSGNDYNGKTITANISQSGSIRVYNETDNWSCYCDVGYRVSGCSSDYGGDIV